MIVRVTLKDPDTMHDAVLDQAQRDLRKSTDLSDSERNLVLIERADAARAIIASQWMEYGEYLTVEFDTEKKIAKVIKL